MKTELDQTIGQKLKSLRLKHKLTLKSVANTVDLSIPTMSEFERDITTPSIKSLKKLCQFYSVTVSSFFRNIPTNETEETCGAMDRF